MEMLADLHCNATNHSIPQQNQIAGQRVIEKQTDQATDWEYVQYINKRIVESGLELSVCLWRESRNIGIYLKIASYPMVGTWYANVLLQLDVCGTK